MIYALVSYAALTPLTFWLLWLVSQLPPPGFHLKYLPTTQVVDVAVTLSSDHRGLV